MESPKVNITQEELDAEFDSLFADAAPAAEKVKRNEYQFQILMGLQRTGKHVYQGTVSAKEKLSRRKAGKAAKISRRGNR